MRKFSPYVFSRIRQSAFAISYKQQANFFNSRNCFTDRRYILNRLTPHFRPRVVTVSRMFLFFTICILNLNPVCWANEDVNLESIVQLSMDVDNQTKKLGSIKWISDHLKNSYHIHDDLIFIVREQEIGYGQMYTVFALAERMPGGINTDNVTEVIDIHQGRLTQRNWQQVASLVGVDFTETAQRVQHLIGECLEALNSKPVYEE